MKNKKNIPFDLKVFIYLFKIYIYYMGYIKNNKNVK